HGIPHYDAHQRFCGYIGSCVDITDRKQSETSLQQALAELEQIKQRLDNENTYLRHEMKTLRAPHDIVGQSNAIQEILTTVDQVAETDSTVLLLGETGTGKERFAQA